MVDAQTCLEEAGYTVLSTGKGKVYDMSKYCPNLGEPEGLSRIAASSSDVDDFMSQINCTGGCDVSALGNFAGTAATTNAGKLKSMPKIPTAAKSMQLLDSWFAICFVRQASTLLGTNQRRLP